MCMCCRPQVMHFRECAKLTRWDAAALQHFVQSSLSWKNYVLCKQFHIRWFCHCIMQRLFRTLCKRFVLFGRFFQTMLVGVSMIVNLNGEPRRFDFLGWGLTASRDNFFQLLRCFCCYCLESGFDIQQSWHCNQSGGRKYTRRGCHDRIKEKARNIWRKLKDQKETKIQDITQKSVLNSKFGQGQRQKRQRSSTWSHSEFSMERCWWHRDTRGHGWPVREIVWLEVVCDTGPMAECGVFVSTFLFHVNLKYVYRCL